MRWTRPPCESPCFYVVLNTVVELNGSEYVAFMLNFQTLTETGDGISGATRAGQFTSRRKVCVLINQYLRNLGFVKTWRCDASLWRRRRPVPRESGSGWTDLGVSGAVIGSCVHSPFPEVAESVQEELDTYRAQEDEVKRLKSIMGLEGEDEGAISMSDNRAKLTSAVSSLPELLEKKRLIDLHTNVATAVLDHIKSRKLDVYFEYEEKLMSKATLDKSLLDIISDPDAGTPEDKMRLFLIYYISAQQAPSESDLEQYKTALLDTGCDLSPLNYIKQWKAFTKMAAAPANYGSSGVKPMGLFSRVMNSGSQFVMEGVKNLVPKQDNLPVTRILDNMMEMKSHPETDDYRYFDPKMLRGSESSIPRNKNPFQEAIVFVVGGGNYIEYQNLVDYSKSKQGKKVVYGCSELFNATQFIKQLAQLGQK
uniref:Sec1 family domain containing 1 n=1 Tax=Scophthalmus maximus TaxID=52904 RepID=A0A8D3E354_SCOMX